MDYFALLGGLHPRHLVSRGATGHLQPKRVTHWPQGTASAASTLHGDVQHWAATHEPPGAARNHATAADPRAGAAGENPRVNAPETLDSPEHASCAPGFR